MKHLLCVVLFLVSISNINAGRVYIYYSYVVDSKGTIQLLQYVTTDKKDGKDMINVYIGSSFSDRAQVEESVQKFLAKDWNYLSKNYSNLLASKAR